MIHNYRTVASASGVIHKSLLASPRAVVTLFSNLTLSPTPTKTFIPLQCETSVHMKTKSTMTSSLGTISYYLVACSFNVVKLGQRPCVRGMTEDWTGVTSHPRRTRSSRALGSPLMRKPHFPALTPTLGSLGDSALIGFASRGPEPVTLPVEEHMLMLWCS